MNPEMSFDEAASKTINSGLLSEEEIKTLQSSLAEMRNLADKKPFTKTDERKLSELRYTFDDLAVKGMPEFEYLRPQPKSVFTKVYPVIFGVLVVIIYIYFTGQSA
ncbi:hypothetical protein [Microbulbifer sp. SSSA005]|uniref:hypothetical protein n=1 Tax=Microbulbifer sp. SSSA005 TaxID=3243378 RepID=UPI00403911B8